MNLAQTIDVRNLPKGRRSWLAVVAQLSGVAPIAPASLPLLGTNKKHRLASNSEEDDIEKRLRLWSGLGP